MKKEIVEKLLKKVKKDYEATASEFSESRSYLWEELKQFKKYVKDGDTVLDLGCGNGRLYEVFKDMSIQYVGADNSPSLIEEAKKKWPENEFVVADALDLPFEDGKFDIVFMVAILHHLPSEELRLKVLENIKRVLKDDGILIMTNWNLWQKKYLTYVLKYTIFRLFMPDKKVDDIRIGDTEFGDTFIPWKKSGILRYYHAFRKSELKNLVKKSGLKLENNYHVKTGNKTNSMNGANIVTIIRK